MGRPAFTEDQARFLHASQVANLVAYGFSPEQAELVISKSPNPHFYRNDTVNHKLQNFESCGFTKREVMAILLGSRSILGSSEESVNLKLKILEEYGFTKKEIKKIIVGQPNILSLSEEKLRKKFQDLEAPRYTATNSSFTLTRDEVRALVITLPHILGLNCEHNGKMDRKLRLMALITDGDKAEMLAHAQRFRQGPAKTLSRIKHLMDQGKNWKNPSLVYASVDGFHNRVKRVA